ncbi:hypothetical protein MMC09_005196 [Bachmanniomyces sp. S44760]|nr:hypothetical protein [Bachmanniomyces sp. S44760]
MARSSRFSVFRLDRKSQAPKERDSSRQGTKDEEVLWKSNAKLETLLGMSDKPSPAMAKQRTAAPRSVRTAASFVSEVNYEDMDPRAAYGRALRPKASSPVLGKHAGVGTTDNGSTTANDTPHLKDNSSSLDVKRYYDSSRSPLAISQQTSASSARDLALRKGKLPILKQSYTDSYGETTGTHARPTGMTQDHLTADSRSSSLQQLESSKLFPPTNIKNGPPLSPGGGAQSPSTTSFASEAVSFPSPPISPSRRNWLGWRSKRSKQPSKQAHTETHKVAISPPVVQEPDVMKEAWYDDHEGDNTVRTPRLRSPSPALQEGVRPVTASSHPRSKMRDSVNPGSERLQPPTTDWKRRSVLSTPSHESKSSEYSSGSLFSNTDLHKQSVLALSSSDDESEPEREPAKTHRIRRSVVQNDTGEEAVVSFASTATAARPLSIPNVRNRQTSSNAPRTPTPTQSSKIGLAETTQETTPPTDRSKSRLTPSPSSRRPSRLMAVTKEEEKLLEAMRLKRASMRRSDSSQASPNASERAGLMTPQPTIRRPKTADADKRSSFFETDTTDFPVPPRPFFSAHKVSTSRKFTSTEDLHHGEPPPRPLLQSKPEMLRNNSKDHVPLRSSSLYYNNHLATISPPSSFSPSDILPSPTTTTATSQGEQSPRTPLYDTNINSSTESQDQHHHHHNHYDEHSRPASYAPASRTTSSIFISQRGSKSTITNGTLMLDDEVSFEEMTEEEEEDDIVGWALSTGV